VALKIEASETQKIGVPVSAAASGGLGDRFVGWQRLQLDQGLRGDGTVGPLRCFASACRLFCLKATPMPKESYPQGIALS
jgi:hypothetical protein